MEKNKLEISGKTSPDSVSASYKPIPEKDMEEQAVLRPKSLIKVKDDTETDGANEKMLPSDEKAPEVVIVFNNDAKSPQNGDAKLEMAEAKQAFVGLTKEELMKFANEPFWVRLRWFLFISFWLLWAGMLVGAVMIIYAAPKCDPPPPRTWYQQGPVAQLPPDSVAENLKLDKNMQALIVPWKADAYEPLENNVVGLALVNAVIKMGPRVILELDPTFSNVWFAKSEAKDPEFDGYYIWRPPTVKGSDTDDVSVPNNWMSPTNRSSWKFSNARGDYYYAPFDKPHLNFRNPSVIEEFDKVIENVLALNVSGVRLSNAAFLLVNSTFKDEEFGGKAGPTLNQYDFYSHSKTQDLSDLGELLVQWRTLIRNKTDAAGTLMVSEQLGKVDSYKVDNSFVVDMPLQSSIFSMADLSVNKTANDLKYTLNISAIEWPLWEAKTNALPRDVLNILIYLLPGAPLIDITEEVNTELLSIRKSPSIMRGICKVYSLQNNTILAFIRTTPGSPGILVLANPTNTTEIANVPQEILPLANIQDVTIRHFSNNYNDTNFMDVGAKKGANAIPVTPKSAIILEYVPKKDE